MGRTRWDDTKTALEKQPDDEIVEHMYSRLRQAKPLLSLYIQGSLFKKLNLGTYRTDKDGGPVPRTQKFVCEKHFSSREKLLDKPDSRAAAAKGKSKGKGELFFGDCTQWTIEGACSRGEKCGGKRSPARFESFRKENQPTCTLSRRASVRKEMHVIVGMHLSALIIKEEIANLGISVRSSTLNRLVANRRSGIFLEQSPTHSISPKQRRKLLR